MESISKKGQDWFINLSAVLIFPFCIISLETILFHLLIIVSNYLQATTIISIAMFGIALGGLISFYLLRFSRYVILSLTSLLFTVSIGLSYFSIVRLDNFDFPWLLIFPFLTGSVIVSSIFSKANSHKIYFIDLTASALGVVYPVIAIPFIKSESSMILLAILPLIFIIVALSGVKNSVLRTIFQLFSLFSIAGIALFLVMNVYIPRAIHADEFDQKIKPFVPLEKKIINNAYALDKEKKKYLLKTDDPYRAVMARNVLNKTEYYPFVLDLSCNYRPSLSAEKNFKIYTDKLKDYTFLFSEDNIMGRIEYITKTDKDFLYINNGSFYDRVIFKDRGLKYDARFPNYMKDAKVFIMGASADGIVKSVKRLPGNPTVTGVEFNPIIHRTMSEGYFFEKSERAYENTVIFKTEGRAYLRSHNESFDMITHMNNHAEHGAVCSLAPEYPHTSEAVQEMLMKLTDRGLLVYEEILWSTRSNLFFLKFINTIVYSLKEMGIDKPEDHILVYKWDYWNYSKPAVRSVVIKRTPFTKGEKKKLMENLTHYIKDKKIPLMSSRQPVLAFPGTILPGIVGRIISGKMRKSDHIQLPDYYWSDDFNRDILSHVENESDRKFVNSLYHIYPKRETKKGFDFVSTVYNFKNGRHVLKRHIKKRHRERYIELLEKSDYSFRLDLSPITDDRPFPFNVYAEKKEVLSILKIVGFLSLLIFIPVILIALVRYSSVGLSLVRHSLFFTAVGFGYMLVEIVLMQFFQRFIGIPVYSVIITLGGLLFFSGVGSIISSKWHKETVITTVFFIPVVLFLYHTFLGDVFNFLSSFPFEARLLTSVVLMMPLSVMMGVPFPKAMEQIKSDISQEYATLMYAISGAAGTIAATSAIYFNAVRGFSFTFIIGMSAYTTGAVLLFFILRKK